MSGETKVMIDKRELAAFFDRYAPERDRWKRRNRTYHRALEELCREIIPPGSRVLELGCGTGDLLHHVRPRFGLGVDLSREIIRRARRKYPALHFVQADAEQLPLRAEFDFVILSDLVGHLEDIWASLRALRAEVCSPRTRVVVTYHNFVWQPVLEAAEKVGLKMPQRGRQNWLGADDLENLLRLTDFGVVESGVRLLIPKGAGERGDERTAAGAKPPLVDRLNRRLLAPRLLRPAALVNFFVAEPIPIAKPAQDYACSVVVPCRNEAGNIAACVERMPEMGAGTEIIFVDGASSDGTVEAIEREIDRWRGIKDIKLIQQVPRGQEGAGAAAEGESRAPNLMLKLGKGDAVRQGFAAATGDVLMILDADLTVPPEDLPRFYAILAEGKGEFVNGTRLVYPMETEAMRAANMLGNKTFSWVFTWLLDQRIKDTLCGTKVLFKKDYERIAANRAYFGDFDPFGDFDLLFGAARLNLKIVEMPVRYRRRTSGESKVRVVKHGVLLARMCWVGFRKFKLKPKSERGEMSPK